MRCRDCGADFPVREYKELMDEYLECQLANVPCDKL
ncbi:MAG: dual CXXC motif small (seleno)protein [Desulfosudaceae bacterium]